MFVCNESKIAANAISLLNTLLSENDHNVKRLEVFFTNFIFESLEKMQN